MLRPSHKKFWIAAVLVLGIGLRLAASTRGHNWDLESWAVTAGVVERGGNVYTGIVRNPYGPVWPQVVHGLWQIAEQIGDPFTVFRNLLCLFLTLADIALFALLARTYGFGVGVLFFINPISIIISGYHGQFDNFAVLLGLLAIEIYGPEPPLRIGRRQIMGLLLLGVSLMTKHVFILFPLWLAAKHSSFRNKLATLGLPVFLFLIGFIPSWEGNGEGVINHVLLYRTFAPNAPFWLRIAPQAIVNQIPIFVWFISTLAVLGFVFRKRNNRESALIYTACIVLFSSAVSNAHLAITVPFVAVYMNPFLALFTASATLRLLINDFALSIEPLRDITHPMLSSFNLQIACLLLGLLWVFHRERITQWGQQFVAWFKDEAQFQLRGVTRR